ncbi:hypothetical protein P7C73_g1617, partial [Tremellales sp. Uapishka_1]
METSPSSEADFITPATIHTETFSPISTADLAPLSVDEPHPFDTQEITSTDVQSDPILSSLAKHQSMKDIKAVPPAGVVKSGFKARPAPTTMRTEGMGPRMTKSAALRLGLAWDKDNKPKGGAAALKAAAGSGFDAIPGHKRNLDINIKSLSHPAVEPRSTKSSQLRSGQPPPAAVPKRDHVATAAANKLKADEEKLAKADRRKSMGVLPSLSAPAIVPRTNKASTLRTGAGITLSKTQSRVSDDVQSKLDREEKEKAAKLARRASVAGVKSLGLPSIMPRLNKAAKLRAPPVAPASATSVQPATNTTTSSQSIKSAAGNVGPKSTKSSLLRAGMGAKVGPN